MAESDNIDALCSDLCRSEDIYKYPDQEVVVNIINTLKKSFVVAAPIEYEKSGYRFSKFIKSCNFSRYLILLSSNGLVKFNGSSINSSYSGRTLVYLKKQGDRINISYGSVESSISLRTFKKIFLYEKKIYISNLCFSLYSKNNITGISQSGFSEKRLPIS